MPVKSAALFEQMKPVLKEKGSEVVKKVGAVFAFEIKPSKDAKPEVFTVDLKNGSGRLIRH